MRFIPSLIIILLAASCKPSQHTATESRTLPEVTVKPEEHSTLYRATVTKQFDLIHTDLDVHFDWTKHFLYGKALLSLHPHFYPSAYLWLDARSMKINGVMIIHDKDSVKVNYSYQADSLGIPLDKVYTQTDTVHVYISYVAMPDTIKTAGSLAITSDKGLYFINPDGKEPGKPKQIWTQGETQSNSAWFPTIDAPNQKMTQQIKMTVDSIYQTLSNGLLISSKNNGDGTRTDTWRQNLPHAPYLAMMTVGQFSIVKDQWRGKEVNYYVEPKYERVARKIFGNTPGMMEYFSKLLKVDFPWDKYSQVVVRDYVSGAMENTSATLHGDLLQQDEREMLEDPHEDYISHELFHQWFGDLVTCESWSNITLNESFANYAEYIWNEYKYGRDEADIYKTNDMNAYFREAKTKQVPLVRFNYDMQEDVFDRHSYEKGGCILHMLRKYVGDDAFYTSLNKYLVANKYGSAEVPQLRLAFEDVTGKDLNWFFNQWYYDKGHPRLDITYSYIDSSHRVVVSVKQLQDTNTRIFRLPVYVDIYASDSVHREKIVVNERAQSFSFYSPVKPDLVNFDAEKSTLCLKNDHHSPDEWIYMYRHALLFNDRLDALKGLHDSHSTGSPSAQVMMDALNDKNWKIRQAVIKYLDPLYNSTDSTAIKRKLAYMSAKDPVSKVRNAALQALGDHFLTGEMLNVFRSATTDSSYVVMSTGLEYTTLLDSNAGLSIARRLEKEMHPDIRDALAKLYSAAGNEKNANYMQKAFIASINDDEKYSMTPYFSAFILRLSDQKLIEELTKTLFDRSVNTDPWHYRLVAERSLEKMKAEYERRKTATADHSEKLRQEHYISQVETFITQMKTGEKDENLLKYYKTKE